MNIIVTGGAGFIGSALVRFLLKNTSHSVVNVDKLTYAGNLASIADVAGSDLYHFECVDICDRESVARVLEQYQPDAVMHLAAESHVDRSIEGADAFVQTNVVGTYRLLEACYEYWKRRDCDQNFRLLHVSTDEVYGDLEADSAAFTEENRYLPSSPYAATKASSDHLVRAWHRTFGLPILLTNCSNNYGPYQFPEKLIPHMILNALHGKPLPVYGDGKQVRDWLYVEDHVDALYLVLREGKVGQTYNIGGSNEVKNIDVVRAVCELLQDAAPAKVGSYQDLIEFVEDRPGHDRRYAIDCSKICDELGWVPTHDFTSGLSQTVSWYVENEDWWKAVLSGEYRLERKGRDT